MNEQLSAIVTSESTNGSKRAKSGADYRKGGLPQGVTDRAIEAAQQASIFFVMKVWTYLARSSLTDDLTLLPLALTSVS